MASHTSTLRLPAVRGAKAGFGVGRVLVAGVILALLALPLVVAWEIGCTPWSIAVDAFRALEAWLCS